MIRQICEVWLELMGCCGAVSVEWDNINLQDEAVLAEARLRNAQAAVLERKFEDNNL